MSFLLIVEFLSGSICNIPRSNFYYQTYIEKTRYKTFKMCGISGCSPLFPQHKDKTYTTFVQITFFRISHKHQYHQSKDTFVGKPKAIIQFLLSPSDQHQTGIPAYSLPYRSLDIFHIPHGTYMGRSCLSPSVVGCMCV